MQLDSCARQFLGDTSTGLYLRMFRWRISIFDKTPARSLGILAAPDEASACTKAIEFSRIEPALQFRVVAVRIEEAKKPARAKVGAKS